MAITRVFWAAWIGAQPLPFWARLPQQLQGPIRGSQFVASPDGRWLFADDPYAVHPNYAAFSQDGQYLAWAKTNEVIVYRIAAPAPPAR